LSSFNLFKIGNKRKAETVLNEMPGEAETVLNEESEICDFQTIKSNLAENQKLNIDEESESELMDQDGTDLDSVAPSDTNKLSNVEAAEYWSSWSEENAHVLQLVDNDVTKRNRAIKNLSCF